VAQVVLYQGTSIQTIYPRSPASITLERRSYLGAYGLLAAAIAASVLIVIGVAVQLGRRRVSRQQNRPEMVKVMGGYGTALRRNQSISIGGDGCEISIPGVAAGTVLATAEWTGTRGELNIQPASGFEMKIRGAVSDGSHYRVGQPLEFVDKSNGAIHAVTLIPANSKDIGFGTPLAASVSYAGVDTGFSDSGSRDSFGSSSAAHQQGDTIDSYI
jgi:hypothetical protein